MICENCKKENASLIFYPEKDNETRGRYVIWQKYLCSKCYIDLTGMRGEYKKFCEKKN
jgi:hypothetical protein